MASLYESHQKTILKSMEVCKRKQQLGLPTPIMDKQVGLFKL